MKNYYDLIVIGGGVAGNEAAEYAACMGLSVLLIEMDMIGGTCLNSGCIPSKYYLSIAHELESIREKNKLFTGEIGLNYRSLVQQLKVVVDSLREGMKGSLKNSNVEVLMAEAKIKKLENEIIITANEEEYFARNLIIAAGTETAVPAIEGIEDEIRNGFVLTNSSLFQMDKLPESIVIVGGGVSGIEMADAFNAFGSEVTVIEATERILREFDYEISLDIKRSLESKGIKFVLNSKATEICEGSVFVDARGEEKVFECDNVYLCIGRKIACTEMLQGLIPLSEKNFIWTDENYAAKAEHVYAIGDVNGKSLLAHSAIYQAQIAVNAICGIETEHCSAIVPKIIYISPECIQVGETEESARAKNLSFDTVSVPMNYSGRYVATKGKLSSEGKIKLLIDQSHRIIGASMISCYASEIAMTLNLFITSNATCDEILKYIFAHPTEGEIIRKCILLYKQRGLSNDIFI
jgi:dihydrolipoamide dehydrogenase